MNKKKTYDIPAALVHVVDGREYRVNGRIVGINEAAETVSMTFKGYKGVEHGIPMSAVYVTEGILDTLKDVGRKAVAGVKKLIAKVRGFLLPKDDNGEIDLGYLNHPANIAIMNVRGDLPEAVHFYPSDQVVDTAAEYGINVKEDVEPLDYAAAIETEENERYWGRVMREFVKNESLDFTVADAAKAVNEKYYSNVYNKMVRNALNEAIVSMHNPGFLKDKYGKEYGFNAAVGQVTSNIMKQLTREIGQHAVEKPIVIWGAPGIGKTMILKGIVNIFKEEYDKDLMIMDVQCSSLTADDWGLPTTAMNDVSGEKYATTAAKTWLPVYHLTNNAEHNEEVDDHYNSGAFLPGENPVHDGGIIFFDELSRLPLGQSQNLMMALVDQCTFESQVLASKWALVFASNRLEDVRSGDVKEFIWEAAKSSRFKHITFVPKLADWLTWCRKINRATGRQNLDESYCAFIEQTGESVWYDALDFGSRENVLDGEDNKVVSAYNSNPDPEGLEAVTTLIQEHPKLQGHLTWNSRSWEKDANNSFFGELELGVFYGHPELYRSIFTDGNLDPIKLERALKFLSPHEWERWANNYQEEIDPSGRMSRAAFIDTFRQKITMEGSFGEKSRPAVEWENYNNYKKTFTPEVCASIWEKGKMPTPSLQKDDDKTFSSAGDYNATDNSRWKSKTNLAQEVMSIIMNSFPGGIQAAQEMCLEDAAKIAAAPDPKPADFDKLADKWMKAYTIKIDGNDVPCLMGAQQRATKDPVLRANYLRMFKTLENSKLARMLANVAMYFVKVGIQMKVTSIISSANTYLHVMRGSFIKDIISGDKERQEAMIKSTELSKTNNDKAKNDAIAYSLIGFPAAEILTRGINREARKAQSGSYNN